MNRLFAVRLVRACCRLIGLQLPQTSCLRVQSSASGNVLTQDLPPFSPSYSCTLTSLRLLVMASMLIVSPHIKAQFYAVEEIGSLGGIDTVPWRINATGQVVGYDNVNGNWHAFLYSKGQLIDLHQPNWEYSLAWGINDQGVVVGEAAVLPNSESRAFKFEDGAIADLGIARGRAQAINNQGHITGHFTSSDGTVKSAFLYQNGLASDIGSLGGATTFAYDINDNDQIVGESAQPLGPRHAFLYGSGGMTDLGSLDGSSAARAVNSLGQVVGEYWTTIAGTAVTKPFLHGTNGMRDLCPPGDRGKAYDINDKGEAVVSCLAAGPLLVRDGVSKNLNTLIDQASGWTIGGAYSINNAGQMAAVARIGNVWRAVILNPPSLIGKELGKPECENAAGNPINIGTGNKYQTETDSVGTTPFLSITRHYNSQSGQGGLFGNNWGVYGAIRVLSASSVIVSRPDQQIINYTLVGSDWKPDADIAHKLVKTISGWKLTTTDNVVENFDATGRLLSTVRLDGFSQTFT